MKPASACASDAGAGDCTPALAGCVPDRLLVGGLEILDVQHLASSGRLGKRASKAFSSAKVMFSCLRPPLSFGLSCFDAAMVRPCARGSPCSATRPLLPQSPAA